MNAGYAQRVERVGTHDGHHRKQIVNRSQGPKHRKCTGTQECTTHRNTQMHAAYRNKEHTEVDRADRKGGHAEYTSHRKQGTGTIVQENKHNARVYNVQDGQHAEADKA